ncbi:peptidase inhibitor family I36 protein [Streptomonospora sediminis]
MLATVRRAGIAAAITFAVAGTASGVAFAENDYNCRYTQDEFCLYENYDFNDDSTNHVRQWTTNDDEYHNNNWYNSNDELDNEASSVWNRTGCDVTLYQHTSYSGSHTTYEDGERDGNLKNDAVGDNRASSHKIRC